MRPIDYVNECLRHIEEEKTRLTELAEDTRKVVDYTDESRKREAQNKIAQWMRQVETLTHSSIRLEAIREELAGSAATTPQDPLVDLMEKWSDPEWREQMGAWNTRMNEGAERIRQQFSAAHQFDDGSIGPIFMGGPL